MLSRSTISAVAGAAALGFIGYCFYFDRKRRSDPDFKQKLRERRRKEKEIQSKGNGGGTTKFPDLKDTEAMQRFFLQEIQVGEELLAAGDLDNGCEHLSNAVAVCGQPQQLLGVLQQTLPAQIFQALMQRLPEARERLMSASATSPVGPPVPPGLDLDLE